VSIGATLAAARRRAGLSVGDLSQRTRIRENIIEGIEQDDYTACGGDFYARGHIRALATAVGEDPQPLIDEFDSTWRSAKEITAAEAFSPGMPLRTREHRRVRWTALLAAVVLAVLGFASYKFVSGAGHTPNPAAATSPHHVTSGPTAPSSAPAVQASTAQPSPTPPSPTPTPTASPVAAQALSPASVAAFGPAGTADGDHPGQAAQAVAGDPATPWISDWYATANFGDLQSGTGLLLDMGRTVTVTSVRRLASRTAPGGHVLRGRRHRAADPGLAGPDPLRAHLVHQAATRLRRNLPGQRLPHHGPRPALNTRAPGLARAAGQ
jgi:cytoskeletal protein RodZ